MKIKHTLRGFGRAEFLDRYGSRCSIQESSLATEPCIWLGVDIPFDASTNCRMHLNQSQVRDLMPMLETFVKTGNICEETEES